MFGRLGWAEILVIVVLLVILFGSAKIPGMMKNLANGVNVFKKELKKDNGGSEKEKNPASKRVSAKPKKTGKSVVVRPTKNKSKK